MRRMVVPFLLVAVGLAGCAGESDEPLTTEDALATDQGVIEGLLVDDRFRPIGPVSGLVLLIDETGEQLTPTDNGEFASSPMDPGRYTLRGTIPGHELTPISVDVRAGESAEATLVARRIVNDDDLVIQYDLAVFIPCNLTLLVQPVQGDCFGDQSGDSDRYFLGYDLTPYEGTQFVKTEFFLNKEAGDIRHGSYQVQITGASLDGLTTNNYAIKALQDGRYDSVLLERGVESEWHDEPLLTYSTWEEMGPWTWFVSGQGQLRKELVDAGSPFGQGVGAQLGFKAQMLVTLFYSDDRNVAESYCGLCVS